MTIDNLLAAEIVTADGDVLHVDAEHHPDLFWAIRGGGGNFGIVTRFSFQLHDVSAFTGGLLVLPATAETVAGFIAAANAAPDELSTIANVMPCPPMPFIPEEHHGKLVILAIIGCVAEPDSAAATIAPLRALATPSDMVQPMPTRTSTRPRIPTTGPGGQPGRSSRPRRSRHPAAHRRPAERLGRGDARCPAARPRRRDGPRPGRRQPSPIREPDHGRSSWPSTTGLDDQRARAVGHRTSHRDLQQEDKGAYVNFIANEGEERSAPPIRARRGSPPRGEARHDLTTSSGATRTCRPRKASSVDGFPELSRRQARTHGGRDLAPELDGGLLVEQAHPQGHATPVLHAPGDATSPSMRADRWCLVASELGPVKGKLLSAMARSRPSIRVAKNGWSRARLRVGRVPGGLAQPCPERLAAGVRDRE
jgi:hypothetical protein